MVWPTTFEKYFEFYAKLLFCFKKKGEIVSNLNFWRIGFKICVLEEHFISYSWIFISYIQCFEVSFQKSGNFSKKDVFQEFRLIQSDFRSIEILFKKFSEPLPGSIDRTCFSINRTSCFKFFLKQCFDWIKHFFKTFFKLFSLSLSDLARLHRRFFVIFNLIFARFFSLKAGKTFIPLILFLFSWFHALIHAF